MTLAELITNSEKRLLSHKLTLKEMSIDRDTYPPLDELVIWLKEFIREEKNSEQRWLKMLVEEKTAENEGLNPNYKIVL